MSHPNRSTPSSFPVVRTALLGAALCALMLASVSRSAAAQARTTASRATSPKPRAASSVSMTSTSSVASGETPEVICDSVAPAPRKALAAQPRKSPRPRVKPRSAVAAAAPAAKPKPKAAVAHAAAPRKRRPSPAVAAGRRARTPVVAQRVSPPRCRSAVAAAPPKVGAVADLVSALPWSAPMESAFPVATAPSLADFGGVGLRNAGMLAAGLLGAGAFWLDSHGHEAEVAVVPPIGPGPTPGGPGPIPGGPETPGTPNPPITTVPEPATLALVASGLAAMGARARRRRDSR